MKNNHLIAICLCTLIILFSGQAFADTIIPVEQTGTWKIGTMYGGLQTDSAHSPDGDGSWYYRQTNPGSLVNTGTSYDGTYTYMDFEGSGSGAGILTFTQGTTIYSADITSGSVHLMYVYRGFYDTSPVNFMYQLSTFDASGSGAIIGHPDNTVTISSHGYFSTLPGNPMEGVITSASGSITGPPVPIPAAFWLFGSGLLGIVGIRRRMAS